MGKKFEDCVTDLCEALLAIDDITQLSLTFQPPEKHNPATANPACYLVIENEKGTTVGPQKVIADPTGAMLRLFVWIYLVSQTDHLALDVVRLVQKIKNKFDELNRTRTTGFKVTINTVDYINAENWVWSGADINLTIGAYDWTAP